MTYLCTQVSVTVLHPPSCVLHSSTSPGLVELVCSSEDTASNLSFSWHLLDTGDPLDQASYTPHLDQASSPSYTPLTHYERLVSGHNTSVLELHPTTAQHTTYRWDSDYCYCMQSWMIYLFHNIKHSADSNRNLNHQLKDQLNHNLTLLVQVRGAQQRWLGPLLPLPPARDLRPALHRLHAPQVNCSNC